MHVQDLLLERSSKALQSLAELDAKELQRHREHLSLWQVTYIWRLGIWTRGVLNDCLIACHLAL